ncbi:LamG domain-containing protein, partial [Verrucomicrobia bacterium]|nr:LamG domain-containing protein [Verrucomicrobiota bacterium]
MFVAIFYNSRNPDEKGSSPKGHQAESIEVSSKESADAALIDSSLSSAHPLPKNQSDEWCEPEINAALAQDPVFEQFSAWVDQYDKRGCLTASDCLSHDPRRHLEQLSLGIKLSRARSKVLHQLIQSDPSTALSLAFPLERIANLPDKIKENMEVWHSAKANLKAIHTCFHPGSTKGQVKRWATLPNGETYRAYTYGKREFIPSLVDVPITGISLNENLAISEIPYRIVSEIEEDRLLIEYAGNELKIDKLNGIKSLDRRLRQAEHEAIRTGRFQSPLIASSLGGGTNLNELRYELITTPMTWDDANLNASLRSGRLVSISSAVENNIVYQLLKDAAAFGILPDNSQLTQLAWIGATDFEDQNGTYFDKDTNQTMTLELNATEGNWFWLSGNDINSSSYQNWEGGVTPVNPNEDFAAINWSTSAGKWNDINSSYRLPFVVEYEVDLTPVPSAHLYGKRKVLIIPARFSDEGNNFTGSSSNPLDPFGNPINGTSGEDSFEPMNRTDLAAVMDQVRAFYLRNSDGTFQLESVITPTVSMTLPKWARVAAGTADAVDNRIFDSTGLTYWSEEIDYGDGKEIGVVGEAAKLAAAQVARNFDFAGPAFQGVLSAEITSPFGNFETTPRVIFSGGDVNVTSGINDPNFEPAQARALVNANGQLTEIQIVDPGAFYHSTPTIYLDGHPTPVTANITMGRTVVSWVVLSTTGNGGLGVVGGPGSHVNVPAGAGVVAHELGHNFGLWHSNRYLSAGLRPNSDEGEAIDYGNPYSLMGSGGISGDLTVPSKVFLKDIGHFGLKGGTGANNATDVAHLIEPNAIATSLLKEVNSTSPNTFRIYRHNYGSAPYPLRTGLFTVKIPTASEPQGLSSKLPLTLLIGGPGEGAAGTLENNGTDYQLFISSAGKGYSEAPIIQVLDTDNKSILLNLDQRWILERAGTSNTAYFQTDLRDFSQTAHRGLRGVEIPASEYVPRGPDAESPYGSYWASYRDDNKTNDNGLIITNATTQGFGTSENALIDTTPSTQGVFSDAFLLLGRTFSDYEADSHITPVRRGGIAPMTYIEAVVNVGTVGNGSAIAPNFELQVSNSNPVIDELITISVYPASGNVSDYAYSWYQDEIPLDAAAYLNKRTIQLRYSTVGMRILKVVVSDMRGGISSQNITLRIGTPAESSQTLVSGQVLSSGRPVQGAKVLISKANVIEHTVSALGSLEESRFPSHFSNNQVFAIDGVEGKRLEVNRGEIHRLYFDYSVDKLPMAFFERPDHAPAEVKLNLLLTPILDFGGDGYKEPPLVTLKGGSMFDTHFSNTVTTIYDYQNQPYGPNGTLITPPSAKSLLMDTNITKIVVRPTSSDPETGLFVHYGGTGQSRYNRPTVSVLRSSYWEDYSEPNASAIAYVDGVGTIQVTSSGSGYPERPSLVVFGAGQDANVTISTKATTSAQKKSQILDRVSISDQGIGFDPNSTHAIALYPTDPFLYFSFNQDESLLADNARYKPTSGFNNRIETNFKSYWQMDEENATSFDNNLSATNNLIISPAGSDPSTRSKWGLKNKAIELLVGDSITGTAVFGAENTLSFWFRPSTAGSNISLTSATFSLAATFPGTVNVNGVSLETSPAVEQWSHLALCDDGSDIKVFLNGKEVGSRATTFAADLVISGAQFLLDEVMIYDRVLNPFEIKYLSGRLYLDLSGNKYHGVPMGLGFEMESTSDAGNVSSGAFDPIKKDGLGRAIDLNGSRYVDLSPNLKALSALDKGSVSVWLKPTTSQEMTILSAANADKNNSYYRLFVRDNGTVRQELFNDGTELSKVSTDASVDLSDGTWHHLVVLIDDAGVNYYIDGQSISPVVAGANDRAFFTDIDGLNHISLGYHQTSDVNATNYFNGQLDELMIYKRVLTEAEIKYLYGLGNDTKVERGTLTPFVDAIGTVALTDLSGVPTPGAGYKELPEIRFYYADPSHFTTEAIGSAELSPVPVDKILLTKDLRELVDVTLPDDRNVSRRYVEYVKVMPPPNTLYDAQPVKGIFGYTSPPEVLIEGSPGWPDEHNASGYPLFFLDENASVEIVSGGQGYDLSVPGGQGFDAQAVRIFGEGYRPPKFKASVQGGKIRDVELVGMGEGRYLENPDQVYFLGDGSGKTFPKFDTTARATSPYFIGSSVRRNTYSSTPQNNLLDINGIELSPDEPDTNTGWDVPPTIFADWANTAWEGHVGIADLDFNATLSEVVVQNPGFRYSIPAKVNLYGGQLFDANVSSTFRKAKVTISSTDSSGGITSYQVTDGGEGYIRAPIVSVTGGGGVGATALAIVDFALGQVTAVLPVEVGRGYKNLDPNNSPAARLTYDHILSASESNASIALRLGGALNKPVFQKNDEDPQYLAPWIEILDRNGSGSGAAAAAKVVDGNITKVIVTKSGTGYVDPIVIVRGSPPQLDPYFTQTPRRWQCANPRKLNSGALAACGHIHEGNNPPAICPGETPPGPQQISDAANTNWWDNHSVVCRNHASHAGITNHNNRGFTSRSCGGMPPDFILLNDPYRTPRADWIAFDANCTPIVQGGRIREILVENTGSRYIQPFLEFKGTGGMVDAVPVFDEKGYLTDVFFDDPRLKNLEIDVISKPFGSGQGFVERPWSRDAHYEPVFGPREQVLFEVHSDMAFAETPL